MWAGSKRSKSPAGPLRAEGLGGGRSGAELHNADVQRGDASERPVQREAELNNKRRRVSISAFPMDIL